MYISIYAKFQNLFLIPPIKTKEKKDLIYLKNLLYIVYVI